MSRLSLKPGGEPERWELKFSVVSEMDYTFWLKDIPDSDLMDIRSTISEYLDAKYVAVEPVKPSKWKSLRWWLGNAALVSLPIGTLWLVIAYPKRPPQPVSTGGVIDQLCMRPDIECSTSIRYVHPQKSGVVEQGDPVPQMECVAVDPQGNYHPEPCSKSEEQ